jgi:type IV pilus assembly protein PilY1
VDVDRDRIADFIYAGDLKGNLWKFDVTSSNANQWDVAIKQGSTPKPLYVACVTTDTSCPSGTRQPITARPEVGFNPKGGFIVYFGTGRYFATGDTTLSSPTNSFYGIFDPNDKGAVTPQAVGLGRSQLLQQTVLATQVLTVDGFTENVRITSKNTLSDTHKGWYIDLPETGERQVSTPILRGGRIVFTTLTPSTDPCGFGGSSWLMEIDALSGARLGVSPFDINRDLQFNSKDYGTYNNVKVPVSGRQSKEGIIKTPGVITAGDVEYKYASGTTGGIDTTIENSTGAGGRQSWRQLQ